MENDILERYKQAESIMQGLLTNRLIMNDAVFPHWIESHHCFWYIREIREGKEFRLVNAKTSTNTPAFDHKALADALSHSCGQSIDIHNLPIHDLTFHLSPLRIHFRALNKYWLFEADSNCCRNIEEKGEALLSPDGKRAAFIRDYNLWIRDETTGNERVITQDGTADNCYGISAINVAIEEVSYTGSGVQALWSPDSNYMLTHQLDTRNVDSRPVVQYVPLDGSLKPQVKLHKYAYPGDKHIEAYRLIAINVNSQEIVAAEYHTLPPWGMGSGFFNEENLGWWSTDSRRAFFIDVARGAKAVRIVEFDTQTGSTRILFEELSDTFVKLAQVNMAKPLFLPLPESDELIWFSERTGWGHLYLYDLNSGTIKHSITEGDWLVRDILHYDNSRRELLLQTAARDPSISPYYRDICKVNIDTGELTTLISGCYEHVVYRPENVSVLVRKLEGLDNSNVEGVSPDGQYIVTTYSRVDTAPVSIMIDRNGEKIQTIEAADISALPLDWYWPEPVKLKSADNSTDIYGVIFRPPGFSANVSYPVLDFSCSLRSCSFIPHASFINGSCFDYFYLLGTALAALGFIVVALEGRGTPNRDKAFQDYNYGDVASTCDFGDRIAGLQQLAERHSYMDLNRVGLTGGDGLAAPVYGILSHPEFYKVAVLHCFAEPRFCAATVSEQRDGISIADGGSQNTIYAEDIASSLKGKLLLIQGMLDPSTPSSTFRLVEALQKANKDFDMLCLPNAGHEVTTYALRRNWDYLVQHLQGIAPPKEFPLKLGTDL